MFQRIQSILSLLFATSLQAQPALSPKLMERALAMRANNLYHQLVWDFVPTNAYTFDQDKGNITYTTDRGNRVVAEVEIMGSFYLGDKTFLWADKNKSVDARWCTRVDGFRELLPEPCRVPKFNTTVDYLRMLSAAFGGHLQANAVDYLRQDETIIFFALKKVEIFEGNQLKQRIDPKQHAVATSAPSEVSKVVQYIDAYVQINIDYNKNNDADASFAALDSLKLSFFKHVDDFLPLIKPFKATHPYARDIECVRFPQFTDRLFVDFSTGQEPWPKEHRAYEVNTSEKDTKVLLNGFIIYGM